jgi:hypothetical protein
MGSSATLERLAGALAYIAILSIGLTQEEGGWGIRAGDFFHMHDYNCLTLPTQQSQENLNLHRYHCRTFKLETSIARGR